MNPLERKESILKAAKHLFSAQGYYQTQISDIHREAGVARGTVYQYFKSKDEIFETLLERLYEDWERALVTSESGTGDYMELFRSRVKNSFSLFFNDPEYCDILLRVALGSGQAFDRIVDMFNERLVRLIKSNLEQAVAIGRVRNDIDLELASNMLGGALSRMLYYYSVKRKRPGEGLDIDKLVDGYIDLVGGGIFPR